MQDRLCAFVTLRIWQPLVHGTIFHLVETAAERTATTSAADVQVRTEP